MFYIVLKEASGCAIYEREMYKEIDGARSAAPPVRTRVAHVPHLKHYKFIEKNYTIVLSLQSFKFLFYRSPIDLVHFECLCAGVRANKCDVALCP